jgi:hypothetical protein
MAAAGGKKSVTREYENEGAKYTDVKPIPMNCK